VIGSFESPAHESAVGDRAKRPLSESHVYRIVQTLHPGGEFRAAAIARPSVRRVVEGRPERPTEPNLDREAQGQRSAHRRAAARVKHSARVRRELPLPQRARGNPEFLIRKLARSLLENGQRTRPSSILAGLSCRDGPEILMRLAVTLGAVRRKERPPKDSRPKGKRFRHGGRKGRRSRGTKRPP